MHDKRIKALIEKRDEVIERMNSITAAAVDENGEERALTEEEQAEFDALEKQAQGINKSIKAEERARDLEMVEDPEVKEEVKEELRAEERAAREEKAFADFIRGIASEDRAEIVDNPNNSIIPRSVADKIVQKVYNICPVYELATRYNVKGTLSIPYYPATVSGSTPDITMAYASEFSALTSTAGTFTTVDLQAFLAGVLTKVSKSLINNSTYDIVGFVVDKMAENIARFIEKECLVGTNNKITGLSTATQQKTLAAAAAVTADELIDLQDMVPDAYQQNAVWIMNPSTRNAIRKLRDGQSNYLLEKDFSGKWGYTLLGKPVYVSDNMPPLATGNKAIYYGDLSGLALKMSEDINIEVLREAFATEHAVGVVGYIEMDAKIEDEQKVAVAICA